MKQLTITVLPDAHPRPNRTDLIVRSSAGMLVAFNNWPAVLRLVDADAPVRVWVKVAERLGR